VQQLAVRGNYRGTQPHVAATLVFDKVLVLNARTPFSAIRRRRSEKDATCPAVPHLPFML